MSAGHSTENLLARFGNNLVPVKVDIWSAKKPRMTALGFHQYFGNSQEFDVLGRKCMDQDVTLVVPTFPGRHPSAFLDGQPAYELSTFLSLMMQIAERYQSNKNCLIGHGFGGLLCLAAVRARLLRPDAIILDEVPISGTWHASPIQELTHSLSNLIAGDPDELQSAILGIVEEKGFGPYSPEWAKSMIRPAGNSFRTILDPALALANWPDFNFTGFIEQSAIPISIFGAENGDTMPHLLKTAIALNPNVRIFKYSGPHKPGFDVTSYIILHSILQSIIDK